MKIIHSAHKWHKEPVALTIGTFDGMHKGHEVLLKRLISISQKHRCNSMVLTFENHPISNLNPGRAPATLMSLNQKILKFKRLGIDILMLKKFDTQFSQISSGDFIAFMQSCFNIQHMVAGHDFRFGHEGMGNNDLLQRLALTGRFEVSVVPPYTIHGKIVSSSLVRELIIQGDVKKASDFLGYPYTIVGKIVKGLGRGTHIGYPTANISFDGNVAVPGFGVYMTKGVIDKHEFWGATSVGSNPTFSQGGIHIETYFIDFNENVYGKTLKLSFIEKLRNQVCYLTVAELVDQISRDVQAVKNMICKRKKMC